MQLRSRRPFPEAINYSTTSLMSSGKSSRQRPAAPVAASLDNQPRLRFNLRVTRP